MDSNFTSAPLHTVRFLEFNPFPYTRWLTPAVAEVEIAVQEYAEDTVAQALDSISEWGRETHEPTGEGL